MVRHQALVHNREPAKFTMRVVGSHQSALSGQVSEAVRIRRRGGIGNILNSKSEYNRCHIARLRVEDEGEQEEREQDMRKDEEQMEAQLDGEQQEWEQGKTTKRDRERKKIAAGSRISKPGSKKRIEQEEEGGARRQKRRKFDLLREDWGETPKIPVDKPKEQVELLPRDRVVEEEQELPEPIREPHIPGSRAGREPSPPDPDVEEQDIGAPVLLPPPLSTTNCSIAGGGGQDTTATNLDTRNKAWTQVKIDTFMLAQGRAVSSRREDSIVGEEQLLSIEDDENEQVRVMLSDGEVGSILDTIQEETKSVSPPSICIKRDNIETQTAPSVCSEGRVIVEDDIVATLREGVTITTDGVSEYNVYIDDDKNSGVGLDELHVIHDMRRSGDDNISDMRNGDAGSVQICEFKRGWCSTHKIKGDKIQKKVKKWTKKKFGYGWVTSTLVEYKCQLENSGNSDHPTTDVVLSGASNKEAALTNSNGAIKRDYNSGVLIGERRSERTGLEDSKS